MTSTQTTIDTTPGGGQTASKAQEPDEKGAPAASEPTSGAQGPTDQKEAVKRAYSEATTALRESHRDEFVADVKARVEGYGYTWSPRPTEAEKRRKALADLLAEDPSLADEVKAGTLG